MANKPNSNPLILDTAVANWAALGLPGSNALRVKRVIFYKPTNIGDAFSIQDSAGNVLLEGTCEVALQSQVYTFVTPVLWSKATGWFLQAISAGAKIEIWYDV